MKCENLPQAQRIMC